MSHSKDDTLATLARPEVQRLVYLCGRMPYSIIAALCDEIDARPSLFEDGDDDPPPGHLRLVGGAA